MKTIFITGTSRGLGRVIASDLADQGYRVVGISRGKGAVKHRGIEEFTADLSRLDEIPQLCSVLVREFGSPYGLINNSAVGVDGVLATQNNKEVLEGIEVNLVAPILMTKYLCRQMLMRREGRIVNISSVVANTGYSGLSVYAATKAGMNGFTRSLSRELGKRNITVNAIQPGFMKTAMTDGLGDEQLAKIARRSALGRNCEPIDVAKLVTHLVGESGANITGSIFTVDAGNTA